MITVANVRMISLRGSCIGFLRCEVLFTPSMKQAGLYMHSLDIHSDHGCLANLLNP